MKTRTKWILSSLAVAGVATGGAFYWQSRAKATPTPAAETVAARRGDMLVLVKATGTVEPEYVVEVKSKASGVVEEVRFQEGDRVEKGALVVKIDPILERRKVTQAEAELRIAQAGLGQAQARRAFSLRQVERDSGLFKKGLVSAESVDVVRKEAAVQAGDVRGAAAQVLRVREQLQEAKDRLAETEIRASATGVVLERTVQPGQIVASGTNAVNGGTTLLKIADLSRLFVRVKVDEADVARVALGQKVTLSADALAGQRFDGKVLRVAPQGKMESNVTVFEVIVEIGEAGRKVLRPMMSANVEIEVSGKKNIVLVPLRAVRTSQKRGKIVTVEGQGPRNVVTGIADAKEIEIVSGVQEGERVTLPDPAAKATGQRRPAAGGQARQMRKMIGG